MNSPYMNRIVGLIGVAAGLSGIAGVCFRVLGDERGAGVHGQRRGDMREIAKALPPRFRTRTGMRPPANRGSRLTGVSSLSAPSTGASPDKTEACALAYPQWGCADHLNHTSIPTACVQVTGALTTGSACAYAGQCQTGFCAIVPGSPCGTCAAMPKVGDSCAQLTTCGQSLACTADTQQCVAYAASGAACGLGQPCGTGLHLRGPGRRGDSGHMPASRNAGRGHLRDLREERSNMRRSTWALLRSANTAMRERSLRERRPALRICRRRRDQHALHERCVRVEPVCGSSDGQRRVCGAGRGGQQYRLWLDCPCPLRRRDLPDPVGGQLPLRSRPAAENFGCQHRVDTLAPCNTTTTTRSPSPCARPSSQEPFPAWPAESCLAR